MGKGCISLILPVYGVEKYLPDCLNSILDQNFKDIEVICVNDCSPDGSQAVLERYAQNDSRFVFVQQETNQGQGQARNKGVEIASGEYIYFLDPDDALFDADSLATLWKVAQETGSDMVMGSAMAFEYEDTPSGKLSPMYFGGIFSEEKRHITLNDMPELLSMNSVWNRLIKRSFLLENDIWHTPPRYAEDVLFSLHTTFYAKDISLVSKATMKYRRGRFLSAATEQKCHDANNNNKYRFEFIEREGEPAVREYSKKYLLNYICDAHKRERAAGISLKRRAEMLSVFDAPLAQVSEEDIGTLAGWKKEFLLYVKSGKYFEAINLQMDSLGLSPSPSEKEEKVEVLKTSTPEIEVEDNVWNEAVQAEQILLERLQNQIAAVQSSFSWRITSPLRKCVALLFSILKK